MQTKSSELGSSNATTQNVSQVPSITGETYTSTAETTKSSVLDDPYETWLRSQAQSLLMRPVTLDEAKLLWDHVDINTRRPFSSAVRPSPLARLLGALRAVFGGNDGQRICS